MAKKIYIAASIGNILEFYDFSLYAFLTPILAKLFFPESDSITQLFFAFNIFAMGFIARPIGAILFGYIGDCYGRKYALSYSILGTGIATALIGLIPIYAEIGILAPIILSILRILQGLCMGGEFSGSLIFASEHLQRYQARYPAFVTGTIISAGVLGWLSASSISIAVMSENALSWRVLFLIGGLAGFVGYYLRKTTFDAYPITRTTNNIFKELLALLKYPLIILQVASIGMLLGTTFYGHFIFPNSFLPKVTTIDQASITACTTFGLFVYMIFLPLMGWLSDKWGHLKMMLIASILLAVLSYSLFHLLTSSSLFNILCVEILVAVILSTFIAPGAYIMSTLFPKEIRYLGTSLSYNLGMCLFGGTTPSISLKLFQITQNVVSPFLYLLVCAFITTLLILSVYYQSKKIS